MQQGAFAGLRNGGGVGHHWRDGALAREATLVLAVFST